MDNATTVHYANLLSSVASKARDCVRDLDPMNDLTFARIRTRKNEIILAPGKHSANYRILRIFIFSG